MREELLCLGVLALVGVVLGMENLERRTRERWNAREAKRLRLKAATAKADAARARRAHAEQAAAAIAAARRVRAKDDS